jgi:uncharacterized protein (TIGR02246 family)
MPAAEEAAAQVHAAEDRRYAAMLAGDATALADLLSDGLIYTHSSGVRENKQQLLARIDGGDLRYVRLEHPVSQVVVLGDAVLVLGEMHADVVVGGQPRRLDNAVLAVWAAQDGGWRLAAFQGTPLPSPLTG